MKDYPEAPKIDERLKKAHKLVIIQADNPDADSLASALALEEVLAEAGKEVTLYCGVDLPEYLRYLPGSSRVTTELPKHFDLSFILDTSSDSLLEQLQKDGEKAWLTTRPCIIIDHHATAPTISFATIICNHPAVATAEVIYELGHQLGWQLNIRAAELLAIGILSDSLGLTSEATTARSIHIIAELVERGVKLAELENARRATLRREPKLIWYKGRLLQRVEFFDDEQIALLSIPDEEIKEFSPLYNPPMLVLDDMRLGKAVKIVAAFKLYADGKITAKIRCNYGYGIGDKLAEHFGGGGHSYASGFKTQAGQDFVKLKSEFIKVASDMLEVLAIKPNEDL